MQMLRDVMLRGAKLDRDLMLGLGAFAVGMFFVALFGAHRRLATAR
jgi:hypothetical protein